MKFMQITALALGAILFLAGCAAPKQAKADYRQVSMAEAMTMMEEETGYILLDVRREDEFDTGHIPSAILLPVGTITKDTASAVIPELDSTVLVYCRSGNHHLSWWYKRSWFR